MSLIVAENEMIPFVFFCFHNRPSLSIMQNQHFFSRKIIIFTYKNF